MHGQQFFELSYTYVLQGLYSPVTHLLSRPSSSLPYQLAREHINNQYMLRTKPLAEVDITHCWRTLYGNTTRTVLHQASSRFHTANWSPQTHSDTFHNFAALFVTFHNLSTTFRNAPSLFAKFRHFYPHSNTFRHFRRSPNHFHTFRHI